MKNFFRTVYGKVILFFSCAVTLSGFALAAIGMCLLLWIGAYTRSEKVIFSDLARNRLVPMGSDVLDIAGVYSDDGSLFETVKDEENLVFKVMDNTGKVVLKSDSADSVQEWDYGIVYKLNPDMTMVYSISVDPSDNIPGAFDGTDGVATVFFHLKDGLPEKDFFSTLSAWVHFAYEMRHWTYVIGIICFIIFAVLYVSLLCAAGHRPDTEDIIPSAFSPIPYDILLIVLTVFFCVAAIIATDLGAWETEAVFYPVVVCGGEMLIWVFLGLSMEAASRVKRKKLLKTTFIYLIVRIIFKGIRKFFKAAARVIPAIPMVWRSLAVWCGVLILDFVMVYFFLGGFEEGALVMFVIVKALELGAVLYLSSGLRRLEKAGQALADGNFEYKTDLEGMSGDIRRYAENLNSISTAMSNAVEDRLKSERMKTVLITNVSHDIKTPLTSIINYAGLIGQETCDNPKISEYSEVLGRQSERLKRLIEDLVEASKASTGNLEVNLVPCDAGVFVEQAGGEYEDKLAKANLQLVVKQPAEEICIMADGRRMWRVFDNLMNNICKYALEGTRIFLSLEKKEGRAVFTFKNTSRAPLDMTEDELMERFTRGDSSRNTEGNGLGLSIAKSMAELQGGSLHLDIDGDFFKAILSFPIVSQNSVNM